MDQCPVYDTIGRTYAANRRPDVRLFSLLLAALGDARTVVNVGAGTGNYEPTDRFVVAVEPSKVMIDQRPDGSASVVRAYAEALPFRDGVFDAALATSTLHHWQDIRLGLSELVRVASRRVVYFSERLLPGSSWLGDEYLPEIYDMAINRNAPNAAEVCGMLGGRVEVYEFPVPRDFSEASAGANWANPERYCDPAVQGALSMFALLDQRIVARATQQLRADLASGAWDERYGHLRTQDTYDLGYRIVVSNA